MHNAHAFMDRIESFIRELDYEVPVELEPFVVAVIHGESKSAIHTNFPVHATGFPLLIYIYADNMPILHINGQMKRPECRLQIAGQVSEMEIHIEINGRFGQLGLMLYPSAPYYLFHKPGGYFLNRWRSHTETSPFNSTNLLGKLSQCTSPLPRITLLLNFMKSLLDKRLPPIPWLDESLVRIFRANGIIAQEELALKADLSNRHFRRKFKEVIGVSPKYFCKVIQMNTIFELLRSSDSVKLHHLALDCGYYDQAHFINDFNKLIGNSPRNFLNGQHAYVKSYLGRRGH